MHTVPSSPILTTALRVEDFTTGLPPTQPDAIPLSHIALTSVPDDSSSVSARATESSHHSPEPRSSVSCFLSSRFSLRCGLCFVVLTAGMTACCPRCVDRIHARSRSALSHCTHIATQGSLLLLYTYTVCFGDISHCIYCFLSVWIVRLHNILVLSMPSVPSKGPWAKVERTPAPGRRVLGVGRCRCMVRAPARS